MSRVYLAQSMAQREHMMYREARDKIRTNLLAAGNAVIEHDYPAFNRKSYDGMRGMYNAFQEIGLCSRYVASRKDAETLECQLEQAWCKTYGIPIVFYDEKED